jgi:hypothetical protein
MSERTTGFLLVAAVGLGLGQAAWCQRGADTDGPYGPGVFPPLRLPDAQSSAPARNDPPFPLLLERPLDPTNLDRPLSLSALPAWLAAVPEERLPRKASASSAGLWGTLTTTVAVNDSEVSPPWEDPLWKRNWKTDESWRCTLAGPVFVFGQVGANSEEAGQSDLKLAGRTGLACKVPVGSLAELQLRAGPGVSYTDPLRPDRMREKSDWKVEVQVRCPLLYGIGLEYQGVALPALTPQAQDQITQDVRLAFPVGSAGKFQLGARQSWTNTTNAQPWTENRQLYLGLELAR